MQLPIVIQKHLCRLRMAYRYAVSRDGRILILWVKNFLLPPGYNRPETEVVIHVPENYPVTPPGRNVFLSRGLRFRERQLAHLHANRHTKVPGDWRWYCLTMTNWDPMKDDFVSFLEYVRSDLTDPEIQ